MENKQGNAKKKVSTARSVLAKTGNEIAILKTELKTSQTKYPTSLHPRGGKGS